MFTIDEIRVNGFSGFQPLFNLDTNTVTSEGGVYIVLADPLEQPRFMPVSVGGHFKQRDPTVHESVLQSKWINECSIVYIGKDCASTGFSDTVSPSGTGAAA